MRITFLLRSGRTVRLRNNKAFPSEFLYGYQQFKEKQVNVSLTTDDMVGMSPPLPLIGLLVDKVSFLFGGLPTGMMASLLLSGGDKKLAKKADYAVVTTNGMGLALGMAKAIGYVKTKVLFLGMGVLPRGASKIKKMLYKHVLNSLHIVTISRGEQTFLQAIFPKKEIHYIPFGVDQHFWTPLAGSCAGGYALAIGNDRNRDWGTLVRGWKSDFPLLKIVTNLPVLQHPPNVEVISGDWRLQTLTDEAVRDLYRGAKFVVVPLRQTVQPSGQSVCLQAMSCGRPVVLSDIEGLWDRNLMRDGETVLLTPPGDPDALAEKVRLLLSDQVLAGRLARFGRAVIEKHLNVEIMAQSILKLIDQLQDCDPAPHSDEKWRDTCRTELS
jgi:hypothetical protein